MADKFKQPVDVKNMMGPPPGAMEARLSTTSKTKLEEDTGQESYYQKQSGGRQRRQQGNEAQCQQM